MNTERIKEIQKETAYPNSVSVQVALLKVWNECEQSHPPHTDEEEVKMKKLLIKWLDKLIYGWADTMPAERKDDPSAWDSMQKELKELQKLRAWIINNG